jgi:TetR/AcrR family transcriptional regulator, lmrAB and yxaGH operons repressor
MYRSFGLLLLYRSFGIMSIKFCNSLASAECMSKQTYIPILLNLFRQFGYEGVTLTKISEATGLGKASLYHHFPGGKAAMAAVALADVNLWLETRILPMLTIDQSQAPIAIFRLMCEETSRFFNAGQNPCLWAVLAMEEASDNLFHDQISGAFSRWIGAIADVLIAAGVESTIAQQRGEDAMIEIQGALIVSRGLRDYGAFQRVLQQLPQQLCRDI